MRFFKNILNVLISTFIFFSLLLLHGLSTTAAPTINIGNTQNAKSADVISFNISLNSQVERTDKQPTFSYYASTPYMVTLLDYRECINVAYSNNGTVYINRYDKQGNYLNSISLDKQLPLFGNVTCDDDGNYYYVSGKECQINEDIVVISIAKYDYNGNFIAKCDIKSLDTGVYFAERDSFYWGTRLPFEAGNCQIACNNGYICVNYAREMFSGHQSNNVIYVECSSMKRIRGPYGDPYMSHSFDQRVIGTNDGGFLLVGHGDAYYRGFGIDRVDVASHFMYTTGYTFHFREGANRDYGYNETFAQLGGIAEISDSYVLCASSERTLSSDTAPSSAYMGHNEARDLFVQYIRKDFESSNISLSSENYTVPGETRYLVGNGNSSEKRLVGNEVDYGVIWLTDLENDCYVANPKIVSIENDNVLIMWEERNYADYYYGTPSVYYVILDSRGNVVVPTKKLNGVTLTASQDPVYEDKMVFWSTNDANGYRINALVVKVPDRKKIEAFTERLYNKCLGREAEQDGLKAWTNQLCWENIDGATVGAGFVFSDEYMDKGVTRKEYLEMLYNVFMGRESDEGGMNYWISEMKNGITREEVFKGFVESQEYSFICSDYGIARGNYSLKGIADPIVKNGTVTPEIISFVERIYEKALNRESDPGGIEYWSGEIANEAKDPIWIAEYFICSEEFESKNLDDTEYVKVLYRTFMGREYDEDGLNYWLARLLNGETRKSVLEIFASCPEFQDIIVSFGV